MRNNPNYKASLDKIFYDAVNNQKYRVAIRIFERNQRLNPLSSRNEKFLTRLGLLYDHLALKEKSRSRRTRLEKKALRLYRRALRQNPNSPSATWGIGRVLWHRKSRKAILFAKRAYLLSKKYGKEVGLYAQNIGLVYKSLQDNRKAELWLLKGMRYSPKDWGVYVNLVNFYLNTKKDSQSAEKYAKALEKKFKKELPSLRKSKWGQTILGLIHRARIPTKEKAEVGT